MNQITDIDIRVEKCKRKEDYWDFYDKIVELINSDEMIKSVFGGREDRLYTAQMLSTIYDKDKLIGFANLIKEKQNPNFLFLDVGIIEEYRGKHVASQILEELKEIPKYIIVETREDNLLANKSLENRTAFIFKYNDRNIYLLQKDRYNEFIENGYYDKLTDHYNAPNDRMSMLAELYKEEDKKGKVKVKTDKNNK